MLSRQAFVSFFLFVSLTGIKAAENRLDAIEDPVNTSVDAVQADAGIADVGFSGDISVIVNGVTIDLATAEDPVNALVSAIEAGGVNAEIDISFGLVPRISVAELGGVIASLYAKRGENSPVDHTQSNQKRSTKVVVDGVPNVVLYDTEDVEVRQASLSVRETDASTSGGRSTKDMANDLWKTIPESVKSDLINDPEKASEYLAREFSGRNQPDWYKKVPKDVQELFLTHPHHSDITHSPTATKPPSAQESARRQSEEASRMSESADHLASSAKHESKMAKHASETANHSAHNGSAASFPNGKMVFGTSLGAAIVCLGLALIL